MSPLRTVDRVLENPPRHWVGDGFDVSRVFSDLASTPKISPMLVCDYAPPKKFPPRGDSKPLGVGQHPHRGFDSVTIAFQGEVEHHDSEGGHGFIYPGDIQWMTAGRGIVHQEYHSKQFTKKGGNFEIIQIWVNLPKKFKMVEPRYQGIPSSSVPIVTLPEDATARVIAGDLKGTKGAAKTFSPVNLWDVSLPKKGSTVDIPYPCDHVCMVFVRRGSVSIGGQIVKLQALALMTKGDGNTRSLQLDVLEEDTSVLIMGGEVIDEPIAKRGPFAMNTEQEIEKAFKDYEEVLSLKLD